MSISLLIGSIWGRNLEIMKKPDPLTIFAIILLPFFLLILPVRAAQIREVLVAAHIENAAIAFWPGVGTHDLIGWAWPVFQMLALSAFFVKSSHCPGYLRQFAAALWLTLFSAELLGFWAVSQWAPDAAVRLGVTLALMLANDFGGALVVEHLVCPTCCTVAMMVQKLATR